MNKLETHRQICRELSYLYETKNRDYGDSFCITRKKYPNVVAIRLEDKLNRLTTLLRSKEETVKDESVLDTLRDIANYAIMEIVERVDDDEDEE
ncbi:MAG: DUF1599 domain-containing protein [Elusimicrobiota bacterium]|nr:DUF1599 domain-containing protein [Elusimicrobiota bacterium]